MINNAQAAIRQPLGQCDPESELKRNQYPKKNQYEVEHDTRDIMETGLLILNEAMKDTYEDDGMPMPSRNRVY